MKNLLFVFLCQIDFTKRRRRQLPSDHTDEDGEEKEKQPRRKIGRGGVSRRRMRRRRHTQASLHDTTRSRRSMFHTGHSILHIAYCILMATLYVILDCI
jgi:hypothetical protein